jgi:hypothetical protein
VTLREREKEREKERERERRGRGGEGGLDCRPKPFATKYNPSTFFPRLQYLCTVQRAQFTHSKSGAVNYFSSEDLVQPEPSEA